MEYIYRLETMDGNTPVPSVLGKLDALMDRIKQSTTECILLTGAG